MKNKPKAENQVSSITFFPTKLNMFEVGMSATGDLFQDIKRSH